MLVVIAGRQTLLIHHATDQSSWLSRRQSDAICPSRVVQILDSITSIAKGWQGSHILRPPFLTMSLPHTKLKRHSFIALCWFLLMTSTVMSENLKNQPAVLPDALVLAENSNLAAFLLQVDTDSVSSPALDASTTPEKCMSVTERVRYFTDWSWIVALLIAIALYAVAMLAFPRSIPSALKWLAAPIVSALIVS